MLWAPAQARLETEKSNYPSIRITCLNGSNDNENILILELKWKTTHQYLIIIFQALIGGCKRHSNNDDEDQNLQKCFSFLKFDFFLFFDSFMFFYFSCKFFNRQTFVLRISARDSNNHVKLLFSAFHMDVATEAQHYIFSPLNTKIFWGKSH